ncbi:MAG: hypothetical protein EG828_03285 [Deltaproteobacteria bacterium]|nr:hypothetical protein [Deltaproteobacteria bacterium]
MIRKNLIFVPIILFAIFGCSPDKKHEQLLTPAPPEQVKALSLDDKEQIMAFKKDLFDIENVSKKALSLVGDEIKLVVKGEKDAVDVASLVDKAKSESIKSIENLMKEAIPGKLPPWFSQNLAEAKKGFQDGYRVKIESFVAVKKFVEEKNPMALLEYKQKESQSNVLLQDARNKLDIVLVAAGLSTGKTDKSGNSPGN